MKSTLKTHATWERLTDRSTDSDTCDIEIDTCDIETRQEAPQIEIDIVIETRRAVHARHVGDIKKTAPSPRPPCDIEKRNDIENN